MAERISVPKTYKLYINGAFPRSERGRVLPQHAAEGGWMANYAWATRKDFRNAMVAARAAQPGWAARSAFNRSLILYRLAETIEDRSDLFAHKLVQTLGISAQAAGARVAQTVDVLFYYAGWADKYAQVLSSVNPVAESFFNFTTPEPTGVVATFVSRHAPLLGLAAALGPVLLSGNTSVLIVENSAPIIAIDLAEAIAVSDVPAGVINILTGKRDELIKHVAGHMDLNAVAYYGDDSAQIKALELAAAENVKHVKITHDPEFEAWANWQPGLYDVLPFIEFKTAWHPIGV